MPIIKPIWSDCFHKTRLLAQSKRWSLLQEFELSLDLWKRYWDDQPDQVIEVDMATGNNPQRATKQQEINKLLTYTVDNSSQKSILVLEAGASPNSYGNDGSVGIISHVCKLNSNALLKVFVKKGLNFLIACRMLPRVARENSLEMLKTLVKHIKLNCPVSVLDTQESDRQRSPLAEAVTENRLEIVKYLLESGADANHKCEFTGFSAMHFTQCTNPACQPTPKIYPMLQPVDPVHFELVDGPPVVFTSCNKPMLDLLVRFGADRTIPFPIPHKCKRGWREYMEALMRAKRVAFGMTLHHRAGSNSAARHLHDEVTRMILADVHPEVCDEE
jgi:hypothetical protein